MGEEVKTADNSVFSDLARTSKLIDRLLERLNPVMVFREEPSRLTQVDNGTLPRSSLKSEIQGVNNRLENLLQSIDL